MILEEGHILRDTAKYAKPLNLDIYKDLVLSLGSIMELHQDKMSLENMGYLKLAQATICQLGLEKELEIRKQLIEKEKGEKR